MSKAIFAAGCFWGVQYYFDQIPGVTASRVGYTGGHTEGPSYEDVCTHTTGHAEAIELEFDPNQISYELLCKQFFRMHNPTQLNYQGPDYGDSYRSAIFYIDDEQKATAEAVRTSCQADWKEPIVTEITVADMFYEAEDYHQKFAERTGRGMCHVPYEPLASK
jgi:methionine-S-sulfoxide reductase